MSAALSSQPAARFLLIAATLASGCMLLWWYFHDARQSHPSSAESFVAKVVVERLDDAQRLDETVELRLGSGFYISAGFVPQKNLPDALDGREIQDPAFWPVALVFYARGASLKDASAVRKPCIRFERPANRRVRQRGSEANTRFIPIGNTHPYAPSGRPSGRRAPPNLPKDWPPDEMRFWTYFGLPEDRLGEYVYELTLYPTARWVSSVRFELGPPVVIRRGELRLDPGDS